MTAIDLDSVSPDVKALNSDLFADEDRSASLPQHRRRRSGQDQKGLFLNLWAALKESGDPMPISEHRFAKDMGRQFRFDWSFVPERVAVEVDGGQYIVRRTRGGRLIGGGRHNTDGDREKRNLAVELGWHILTYTPEMMKENPGEVVSQVRRVLESKRNEKDTHNEQPTSRRRKRS
jgi:very-short-patch-repair endonuclease